MMLSFVKMHGLGNDFIVIDAITSEVNLSSDMIAALADRHTGIGFDQVLIIKPSHHADFFCEIYNADGSEAEQCGNGLRCVARYLHEEDIIMQPSFTIATKAGLFPVYIQDYDHIRVTLGAPEIQENLLSFEVAGNQRLPMSVMKIGNPHAIIKLNSINDVSTETLGKEISTHQYFPQGTNVGFMQVTAPDHIHLRTYERGVGETLACGSNACAATVAGIVNHWLKNRVSVEFRYGSLLIEWEGAGKPIHMTGPAARVFNGIVCHPVLRSG